MTGRPRRFRDFLCSAPGAPSSKLGAWWWMNNEPPIKIRSFRLTDSPVVGPVSNRPAGAPVAWIGICRACGRQVGPTTWATCVAVLLDHLGRCPWDGIT